MALYWPDQKVALEFLDDPESSPFTGDDEGVIIIQATNDDLSDTSLFTEFVSRRRRWGSAYLTRTTRTTTQCAPSRACCTPQSNTRPPKSPAT